MLEIKDLHAECDGREILKGINLTINPGEVHALMGPNGSGKSTLSFAIAGHPKYKITGGDILLNGKSILGMPVHERARLGLFLGFQYPQEISGVSISNFLRTALASSGKGVPAVADFYKLLKEKANEFGLSDEILKRGLNNGFSGGEKKRSEVLQLTVLKPKFAILDEPDSGMDVDGLKYVAEGIKKAAAEGTGVLLVTHYNRILSHVKPNFVHVLVDGKIVQSGGPELAVAIESQGYDKIGKTILPFQNHAGFGYVEVSA
ncbi:Fe-S cluster assembly ATPase SufC [Candidatus Woesearchaeota archaeon]|nr:Fe-S cluster assembly ATPase SufC [Candidatus Woesearchaeota archaeon]